MAHRILRPMAISRVLCRHFISESFPRRSPCDVIAASLLHKRLVTSERNMETIDDDHGWSMSSQREKKPVSKAETLSFIKSTFDELEGANHLWLNNLAGNKQLFGRDEIFLVVIDAFLLNYSIFDHRERTIVLERVKLLQKRYPKLNVFGLQFVNKVDSTFAQKQIAQIIMEYYISFPILLLDMECVEVRRMLNGARSMLFDGSMDLTYHHMPDLDLAVITKDLAIIAKGNIKNLLPPISAICMRHPVILRGYLGRVIEEFNSSRKDHRIMVQNSNVDVTRQEQLIKEPSMCSSFRNLLLYFAGCLTADEDGNRLFISDCNHHRIIITDGDGKVLDCIGSSPGFEDGEFECAKLWRPAASFYHSAENCLYFADSENHAIRRADLERRVLETLYPTNQNTSSIWGWMLKKLGLTRGVGRKSEEDELDSFRFPWHLMKSEEDDILVINRSFETLWIMSMSTGEIKKVLRGTSDIMELCGSMMMDRLAPLKDIYGNWLDSLEHRSHHTFSLGEVPYANLLSSIVKFHDHTIFCDPAGQRVLKGDRSCISYLQLSDLGTLGLPYWLICPLERFYRRENLISEWNEHLRTFSVFPGRCDIKVKVDIPKGTELAAPLEENCIWRQARGSAFVLSRPEEVSASMKVSVAQQWFQELYNLPFQKAGMETSHNGDEKCLDLQDKENRGIDCAVSISPGTSEVVISAVLYLKLKLTQDLGEDLNSVAIRLLGLQKHESRTSAEDDACIKLFLEDCGDLQDVIFARPLHLRVRLVCADHPVGDTAKDTITTDTALDVNVSLD